MDININQYWGDVIQSKNEKGIISLIMPLIGVIIGSSISWWINRKTRTEKLDEEKESLANLKTFFLNSINEVVLASNIQLDYLSKYKNILNTEREIEFLYKSVTTLELHINFILDAEKASIFKILVSNSNLNNQEKMYYYNQLYSRIILVKKSVDNYKEQGKMISESCLDYEKECDSWMIQIENQIQTVRVNSKNSDSYREDPYIQDFIKIYNSFEESSLEAEVKNDMYIISSTLILPLKNNATKYGHIEFERVCQQWIYAFENYKNKRNYYIQLTEHQEMILKASRNRLIFVYRKYND